MGWLRSLIARLQFKRKFGRHPGALVIREDGLTLRRYRFRDSATVLEDQWSFAWSDVRAIHAYKVDLLTVDEICLRFSLDVGGFVVTEEMTGTRS